MDSSMNRINKIVSSLAVATFLLASPATAQPDQGRGPRADWADRLEWRLDMLEGRLDLTDEQRAQVKDVIEAQHKEAIAWFDAHQDATSSERMEFRETHRAAMLEKLETILTSEQLAEYKELRDSRGDMRPRGRRGRR
ncbi:MAG TPA: Spy/CpxP family protein refolding chaperone [Rhodothermales bacterium]